MMIIYIAGLQAVPEDMLEAARIDGANRWQTLWRVTIPNVMPSITICMFLSLTNGFKLFDQNLALTAGRPFQQLGNGETIKTTEMLALNIVNAFGTSGGGNRGVGQAKAVIFFIVVAAISIKVEEPVFESQTKTKLGSKDMGPDGPSVGKFVGDFIKKELDNYLHKNAETSDALLRKIQESEKERKAIAGVTKLARERAKKANLHNKKLRDCRIHLNDTKGDNLEDSCIFITEGDSASGSITKSRDPNLQAVFSLRGKPLNSFGLTKKIVYENEEFNLLQAALNIEDGLEGLRYNKVIIATDADVDGMHIRLLLITFFLQFFPDLIKRNHVYILQTPLFRVRNKQKTWYCYSEEERVNAIAAAGKNAEITRFKGLGEISPDEFKHFIGKDIRLDPVTMKKEDLVKDMLEFYMGKNTMERQNFIIDNLVVEEDVIN